MSPAADNTSIITFRDALGLAMELADDYAFVNAAAIVDHGGNLVDLIVAEGIGRTIDPVIGWLCEPPPPRNRGRPIAQTLVVSVRPFEADVVREQDLRLYRSARWTLAAAGIELIDWIETDGDLFRSYAYVTCPARAWERDPPADRLSDGRPF